MEVQLNLQIGRFSVHFYDFVGVIAGAWRRLVSGCSFCGVLWESGKRNMDSTTVFTVPNAHHIFGSRTGFSDFLVPSGVSFGGCWIAFGCFWGSFERPGGVHGFNTFLRQFWVDFWEFRQPGGNQPSDQNGLARESLNLRSMDYGGSVDMSVFR